MVAISGHPGSLHGIERSQGSVTIVDAVGRLRFERDGRGVAVLQRAFGTVSLSPRDWVFCAAIASSVLWLREISKVVSRWVR